MILNRITRYLAIVFSVTEAGKSLRRSKIQNFNERDPQGNLCQGTKQLAVH